MDAHDRSGPRVSHRGEAERLRIERHRLLLPATGDDIIQHTRFLKQTDVLERARDAEPCHLVRWQYVDIAIVEAMLPAASFNRPVIRLTTVVLPAPLGPISPVIRPGCGSWRDPARQVRRRTGAKPRQG